MIPCVGRHPFLCYCNNVHQQIFDSATQRILFPYNLVHLYIPYSAFNFLMPRKSKYLVPAVLIFEMCSWETLGLSSPSNTPTWTSPTPGPSVNLPPAITVDSLSCSHNGGETYQLKDVSFVLARQRKFGLIGRNGCGKSTFLKILAQATGSNIADDDGLKYTGKIEQSRDCRISYVEQEPPILSDVTVEDSLLGLTSSTLDSGRSKMLNIVQRYRLAVKNADKNPDLYAKASIDMDSIGAWGILTRADDIATRLRVKHLENLTLDKLSGGERKRVALAAALVQDPDVLLLDEPTNHLDLGAIRWLSDYVKEQKKLTMLVVTHDRMFLEEVCENIVELDRGSIYVYPGSYEVYLDAKAARLALEDASVQNAKTKYRRELDWMRRQPKAREAKQKARIQAFYKLETSTKPRSREATLDLSNDGQQRLGNNILRMKNVSLKFGDRVILDDFSYDFNKGDRIGLVGKNGVGKSSFVRVLTGEQSIEQGTIEVGETVVFGSYNQMGIQWDDDEMRVFDFVKQKVESRNGSTLAESPQEAMKLLNQFQFERPRWNERLSNLSGGEKRRLQLLEILTKRPNFLILDEPTNDLDLDTLTALESYLEEFQGVLLVVSHDVYFTDKVCTHLFVFEGDGIIKDYVGSLSEYAECLVGMEQGTNGQLQKATNAEEKPTLYKEDKKTRTEKRNLIKKLERDIEKIESDIQKLKQKKDVIQIEMEKSAEKGWSVLADLSNQINQIAEDIENKELRWLELSEQLESEALLME